MKHYKGNMPSKHSEWRRIGEAKDNAGIQWVVFYKPQKGEGDWRNCKVVADGKVIGKANYWLARNVAQLRFASTTDSMLFIKNKSDIVSVVESLIDSIEA